jgi:hypothetical protein
MKAIDLFSVPDPDSRPRDVAELVVRTPAVRRIAERTAVRAVASPMQELSASIARPGEPASRSSS